MDDQDQLVKVKTMPEVGDIVIYHVGEADSPELKHNYAEKLPAVVVQVWGETCVNLKVFTDGPVDAWKTSAMRGNEPYHWEYRPEIVRE